VLGKILEGRPMTLPSLTRTSPNWGEKRLANSKRERSNQLLKSVNKKKENGVKEKGHGKKWVTWVTEPQSTEGKVGDKVGPHKFQSVALPPGAGGDHIFRRREAATKS